MAFFRSVTDRPSFDTKESSDLRSEANNSTARYNLAIKNL